MNLDTAQLVAIAAALGWASGLRLYAVLFSVGLAGALGAVELPAGLRILEQPPVLAATGLMLALEFLADKIPLVDSLWDAVHTFVRIPAGAALAAAVFGGDPALGGWIAALLGGSLAATSHFAKASARVAINTSPEPFSNLAASLAGDLAVPALLWLAWTHPVAALAAVIVGCAVALVLLALLWRVARAAWGGIAARRARSPRMAARP